MSSFAVGSVEVCNVVEWVGEIAPARTVIPDSRAEDWADNESWLAPSHWNPATDRYRAAVQTWVLRSEGAVVLVDTGVGNDRHRPQVPLLAQLHTDFLDRLAAVGVRPADVAVVVNTHIHYDHVGWNTRLAGENWVPTFPNATYLIPRADRDYFDPAAGRRRPPRDEAERRRHDGARLVFQDSIEPVLDRAVLWDGEYRIDGNLALEAAPGHTPGSSVLRVASGADRAVFVGDLLHSPVQVLQPRYSSCFCEDEAAAAVTRRAVLGRAADDTELVVPAHFAQPGAVEVRRAGNRFDIVRWAG
ncbi:MBL fold metallo-hydrolase [Actinocatenispora sera]|uniref:MBL fold metallo-hydrolase n=1 Tax=Actinocatenispora sera TaxID=390989 RepID=UPI003409107F